MLLETELWRGLVVCGHCHEAQQKRNELALPVGASFGKELEQLSFHCTQRHCTTICSFRKRQSMHEIKREALLGRTESEQRAKSRSGIEPASTSQITAPYAGRRW